MKTEKEQPEYARRSCFRTQAHTGCGERVCVIEIVKIVDGGACDITSPLFQSVRNAEVMMSCCAVRGSTHTPAVVFG